MKLYRLLLLAAIAASYGVFICAFTAENAQQVPEFNTAVLYQKETEAGQQESLAGLHRKNCAEEKEHIEDFQLNTEIAKKEIAELHYRDRRNIYILIGALGLAGTGCFTYLANKLINIYAE